MNIIEVLNTLDGGEAVSDLDRALSNAVREVRENNATATVVLTLKVSPRSRRQIEIAPSITSKLPQRERDTSFFYVNDRDQLTRNDPDQPDLPGVVPMRPAASQ